MRINQLKTSIIVLLFIASLFVVLPIHTVKAQTTTVSVSPQNNIVTVGQTLTIHIEISNVQNLYAVDIALTWSTSMLKLDSNQSFVGVANGVLNSPVLVVQDTADQATGEYNIIATSENPAGPFSGSATVATLTFTVTSTGQSSLTLKSSTSSSPQLASYAQPGSGQTSEPISATVINGNVSTSSSSSSPSPSPTPTSSASTSKTATASSTPTPTATVPELPVISLAVIFVLIALAAVVLSVRTRKIRANSRIPP
ncbi:MAG: cohesin domain-containing protein [Candidatus Bathyarchaeia archaeon]